MSRTLGRGLDQGTPGQTYDVALLRRLWRYIRPYRATFLLALVCLPLTSACMLAQPYLLKLGVDWYIERGDAAGLTRLGLLFAAALLGEFLFFYIQFQATMLVAQRSLADLRRDLFAHLHDLPASFFERTPAGRLVTRLTTDVDAINEPSVLMRGTVFSLSSSFSFCSFCSCPTWPRRAPPAAGPASG